MSEILKKTCEDYLAGKIFDVEFLAALQLQEKQRRYVTELMLMPAHIHQKVTYYDLYEAQEDSTIRKAPPTPKPQHQVVSEYFSALAQKMYVGSLADHGPDIRKACVILKVSPMTDDPDSRITEEDYVFDFRFGKGGYAGQAFREFVRTEVYVSGTHTETYRLSYARCYELNIVPPAAVVDRL